MLKYLVNILSRKKSSPSVDTSNYFNPFLSPNVSGDDLLKILRGEIGVPNAPIKYPFVVIGTTKDSPLVKSFTNNDLGFGGYVRIHDESLWYGKICPGSTSEIVIPCQSRAIEFNPNAVSSFDRFNQRRFNVEPYNSGGIMSVPRDMGLKTLVSFVSEKELSGCVDKVFSPKEGVYSRHILEGIRHILHG